MGMKLSPVILAVLLAVMVITGCSRNFYLDAGEKSLKNGVHLEEKNVGGLKESEVLQIIKERAQRINIEPINAQLDGSSWEISKEQKPGKRVNIEKTLEALLNSNEGAKVKLIVEDAFPSVTAEKLEGNIVELAGYSTPLLDKDTERINNIAIASEKLNYKKLFPGEEFSFNATLGKRTEAKGYEEAPIIVKTEDGYKKGFGVGGGICQLSSTIYNAVEKCENIEITERHIHSKNVGYVPRGKDATVSYGSVDFKFRNNRNYPVMLRVYSSKNYLTVKVFENRN